MKRTALILLTAIYLVSCVGMGVNSFYCCGKLASVSLVYGAAENGSVKTVNGKKCCKNEIRSFRLKDQQIETSVYSFKGPLELVLPSFRVTITVPPVTERATIVAYQGNAPPGHLDIPVYTLNCAYRI